MLVRTGIELRAARHVSGLTLAQVGTAIGSSPSEVGRIERGAAPWVDIPKLSRFGAVVGVDVSLRTYPGGEPLRDIAHLRLSDAFRSLLGPGLTIRAEVPVGDPRDLRAWDLTLADPIGTRCGVELETRFVDAQDQMRKITRKVADGGLDRVLLVIADTRANRIAVRAAAGLLGTTFAIEDGAAVQALAEGRIPPRDSLLFVTSRSRS
jgi:transcriptional regulator with XRE-family HTH domain